MATDALSNCHARIIKCRSCPRLVNWRDAAARVKRHAYATESYWGRPVPGWGDPKARLLVVGLAPAAHGANRTGRMFTGDRSGDWLYRAMHRAGFANQPTSASRNDGLLLRGSYVTSVVHCAPPANKPTTRERDNCMPFLAEELRNLSQVKVIIALGAFAWRGVWLTLADWGIKNSDRARFGHNVAVHTDRYTVIASYHPSQQNTFTGRLTESMLDAVFEGAKRAIARRK